MIARLLILGVLSWPLHATEWRLLEADYLYMEYRRHHNYVDSYMPQYDVVEGDCKRSTECFRIGASALFGLTVIQLPISIQNTPVSIFWRNDVHTDGTSRQVRHVGWFWEAGFPIGDKIEIFQRHHSRHVMEEKIEDRRFPLRDEYVVRFKLLDRSK